MRTSHRLPLVGLLAAAGLTLGLTMTLTPGPATAEGDQVAAVQIVRPWVAPIQAGDAKVKAVIGNDEGGPVILLGADSGVASDVMLVYKGQPVDRVVIDPHDAVGPQGFYLLLNDVAHPLAPGESIEVILRFEDRAPVPVQVAVGDEGEAG